MTGVTSSNCFVRQCPGNVRTAPPSLRPLRMSALFASCLCSRRLGHGRIEPRPPLAPSSLIWVGGLRQVVRATPRGIQHGRVSAASPPCCGAGPRWREIRAGRARSAIVLRGLDRDDGSPGNRRGSGWSRRSRCSGCSRSSLPNLKFHRLGSRDPVLERHRKPRSQFVKAATATAATVATRPPRERSSAGRWERTQNWWPGRRPLAEARPARG